jgi:hypothetical protein
MFLGEVLGENTISATSSTGEKQVVALRVRVIESDNANTSPGDVHHIHKKVIGGKKCEYSGPEPLTTSDFPIGARIQVFADAAMLGTPIAIPVWDLRVRLYRVD